MAKQVMPQAELQERSGDIALPESLFPRIGLFAQMKSPPSLDKFPGTVALRRFRKGEVICQHGDAGWTAFYLLTRKDVEELREYPRRRLQEGPQEKAKNEELLNTKRQEKSTLESELPQKTGKEQEACQKKIVAIQRDIEKAELALANQDGELSVWPGVLAMLEREMQLPAHREAENQQSRKWAEERFRAVQQEAKGDKKRAEWYAELEQTSAAKKRIVADAMQGANPDLAAILHELARAEDGLEVMATAHLPMRGNAGVRERGNAGFLNRVKHWLFRSRQVPGGSKPAYIPNDGPRDISYDSRGTSLYEGDLFGEMSCLYRTPRSATVIAEGDCYLLEMLRNILDAVQKDPGYQARMAGPFKKRLVETFLRELPIFSVLDDRQLAMLHAQAELVNYQPGSLICDEHEHSDCMYLIGSGIVKVMKNVSWLLSADDIVDWSGLRSEIQAKLASAGIWGHSLASASGSETDIIRALNDIIKDPALKETAEFQEIVRRGKLGLRLWQLLADARHDEAGLARCNRQILEGAFAGIFPPSQTANRCLLAVEEIADWKTAASKLLAESKKEGTGRTFWQLLPHPGQEALATIAAGGTGPDAVATLCSGINDVLMGLPLLLYTPFCRLVEDKQQIGKKVMEFLPKNERWTASLFERYGRACNRFLLEAVFPRGLGKAAKPSGPALILAYRSRGEFFGEMGLLENSPRMATCVAYNHPDNDPEREVGPVQLIRIGKEVFDELLATVPLFRQKVAEVIAERKTQTQKALERGRAGAHAGFFHSERANQLGLIEGQKLMLVDLDRCTRCDECVQACVSTHGDGRSRLFLEGPRIDKYLVPATCRSCLDPVCMIGCPVGSIHRGDNRQIIIEDWCIGCERCAKQCPYGAIQMHDTGIIREGTPGWRYMPANFRSPQDFGSLEWTQEKYSDGHWQVGQAPFHFDRSLHGNAINGAEAVSCGPYNFRFAFHMPAELLRQGCDFKLEVTSLDESATVWINGVELPKVDKPKRGRREYLLTSSAKIIHAGRNVLAGRAMPDFENRDILLDARLDEIRTPSAKAGSADIAEKPVTQLAVVCDLCSSLPSGPACVHACPHEAALRVNAPGMG
jgi:Fe-S-cluster-containing hydrogenase component 2/CRP-like cAMP-binding protein